jgi:hypothetical protein
MCNPFRKDDLVRVVYAGRPNFPNGCGWSKSDDHGFPWAEGVIGVVVRDDLYVTDAGKFCHIFLDNGVKLINCAYLDRVV